MIDAERFIAAIVGRSPGFIEVRHKQPDGEHMAQRFFGTGDLNAAANYVLSAGTALDAYVGMAPRVRCRGRSEDVEQAWIVSADCDDDASVQALERFVPVPSIVLRSGSVTASGRAKLHAHWRLREPIGRVALEDTKRRLVATLGSDATITDAARIMRAPGTMNFKAAPRPVEIVRFSDDYFDLDDVLRECVLAPVARERSSRNGGREQADALLEIPASEYVPLLCGRPVERGFVRCPFHKGGEERTPSLYAYSDPARGWYCYGCRDGGDIYDFAAIMLGVARPLSRNRVGYLHVRDVLSSFFMEHYERRVA